MTAAAHPRNVRRGAAALVAALVIGLSGGTAVATTDTPERPAGTPLAGPARPNPARAQHSAARTPLTGTAFQARLVNSLSSTARASRYLGANLSGLVVDRASGAVLWSHRADVPRLPASTQKVVTAFTVLRSMAASRSLSTRVRLDPVTGSVLYLQGGADPSLGAVRLKPLAQATAAALRTRGITTVTIRLDESALPAPTPAVGWKASYYAGDVQRVRGLTLVGYRGADGATAAGKVFVAYLGAAGVRATIAGRAATPAGAPLLASSSSAPIGALLARMLSVSDNDYAEYLFRHAALAAGRPGTFAGAVAQQRRLLSSAGIPTKGYLVHDGSGLSRANRMPVGTLAGVLRSMLAESTERAAAFSWGAMPRAGQTGTLVSRFRTTYQSCARGRVIAKTGTLSDVVGLAGLGLGADRRERVFVLLDNGRREISAVRSALDTLATIVVGCRLG